MGLPAARITDMHVCPLVTGVVPHVGGPVVTGCVTVLTGMMPQARVTDICTCVGPPDIIVKGSATVLVGGLPAARVTDLTAHGGVIVLGYPTVLVGDAAGGGGAGGAGGAGGSGGAQGGGGGGGGASDPSKPTYDKEKAVARMRSVKRTTPNNMCGASVRRGLDAGSGAHIQPGNDHGKNMGPVLQAHGFEKLDTSGGYAPESGDVVVIQPMRSNGAGHTAMYDGESGQWISDHRQRDMLAGNRGNYEIYRRP